MSDSHDYFTPCRRSFRYLNFFEKYFIIQQGVDVNASVGYDDSAIDSNGDSLRGEPLSSTIQKFSFCVTPGAYTIHAIDKANDGWWGGAHYSVLVGGTTVVREEMGISSSSKQSTTFDVALPTSARTVFSDNNAPTGGGGVVFWNDRVPESIENYRNKSGSNTALYGSFVATPAKYLTVNKQKYDAISGRAMTSDPITMEITDR